jgi:type I restriction enzyme, S subunit
VILAAGRKPSGSFWNETIPETWSEPSLRHVVSIRNGSDYKDFQVEEGGYPVIGSGGEFARTSRYLHDGESVLLGRKGSVDKPLYIDGRFWTVDTMFYTSIGRRISAKYLHYFATTIPYDYFQTSTAVPSMTQGDLGAIKVPLPPLAQQQRIVQFLDRETAQIDNLVGEQERLIDLLAEKRQAVVAHLATNGLDPAAPTKPSGIPWLGEIPTRWEVSKVKYVKSVARNAFVDGPFGSNLKSEHFVLNGDVFVIESNFATTGELQEVGLKTISEEHFKTISRSEVRAGDIVIAKIGARFGKSAILPQISKKAVVSANSMKLTVDTKVTSSDWIALQLSVQKTIGDLDLYASVTAQPALSLGGVNQLTVLIPPMHEQTRILDEIKKSSERLGLIEEAAQRMVNLLLERRMALISAAVTGKIDVRNGAP